MTILDAFILTLFDLFNNKVNGLLDTNVDIFTSVLFQLTVML